MNAKGNSNNMANRQGGGDFPPPRPGVNNNIGYGGQPMPPMAAGFNQAPYAAPANYNPGMAAWKNRHSYSFYFCCNCVNQDIAPKVLRSFFCAQLTLEIVFFIFTIRAVFDIPNEENGSNNWYFWFLWLISVAQVLAHIISIIFTCKSKSICEKLMYSNNA